MRRVECQWMCVGLIFASASACAEFNVESGFESTRFLQSAAYDQGQQDNSLRLQADISKGWNSDKDLLSFTPFYRYDAQDDQRTHGDIRELSYIHAANRWEARVGVHKVFWGVTEGLHLVDVINQTDLVEDVDGKQKLGQPMINLSTVQSWGTLDAYYLIGFRERTFPGKDGRPRYPLVIEGDDALYQDRAKDRHKDFAFRYQKQIEALNFAVSYFKGTNRDPDFLPALRQGQVFLIPYYQQMHQWGMENQFIAGDWAWKLEALARFENDQSYRAYDAGFEYTQVGAFNSGWDLGWIIEFLHDSRGTLSPSYFEHDFLFATRFSFNDAASSDALLSVFVDQHTQETFVNFEASHRLSESMKLKANLRLFSNTKRPQSVADVLARGLEQEYKFSSVSQDDYLRLELIYYW
ncbi:MAG TPA: hypothetical protein VFM46_15150 [Pseudomonadales bacterium]|nr:hypothetical protein [Pseudomonadales bacterium]